MTRRRFDPTRVLHWYVRWAGGGDWPFLMAERRYLDSQIARGTVIADVGGGDGKLANVLAPKARHVIILDRETTLLPGADGAQYGGSLTRAIAGRQSSNVAAVRGDATELPFASASLDAVVSSQFLEHIADSGKHTFFRECARVLKPSGILAISTPNGDYIATHQFRFAAAARRIIPARLIARLPRLMRGPWLEEDVAGWEARVGHYDHGCRLAHLRAVSSAEGLEEVDSRFLHTRLTAFWFELLCTFPLLFLAALPLVRVLYRIEASRRATDGINLMMTFRKRAMGGC
jgi:ubiquinone/menaquinone biosynthesis C-methylase UbiE